MTSNLCCKVTHVQSKAILNVFLRELSINQHWQNLGKVVEAGLHFLCQFEELWVLDPLDVFGPNPNGVVLMKLDLSFFATEFCDIGCSLEALNEVYSVLSIHLRKVRKEQLLEHLLLLDLKNVVESSKQWRKEVCADDWLEERVSQRALHCFHILSNEPRFQGSLHNMILSAEVAFFHFPNKVFWSLPFIIETCKDSLVYCSKWSLTNGHSDFVSPKSIRFV